MKKVSSILLMGIAMLAAACGSNNATSNNAQGASCDSTNAKCGILYVSQDSILKYYTFADAVSQKMQELQANLMAKANQLQNQAAQLQNEFNQKLQNNQFLTQQLAETEYRNVQQKVAGYDKVLSNHQAEVQAQVLVLQQALSDSINNYIKDYVAAHPCDAIIIKESTLYANPAMDVTQEIIDGLNARYTVPVETPAK